MQRLKEALGNKDAVFILIYEVVFRRQEERQSLSNT